MYKLEISKRVVKFINTRTPKERTRIAEALQELQDDPYQNSLDIKPLKGKEKHGYRLRIGGYRFLYALFDDQVLVYVYKADNRGDVYK